MLTTFQFKGCNLSLASFYEMELSNAIFHDCKLHQVDWTLANLSHAQFSECDLKNAVFESSILEGVDFSTAFNFSIDPSKNNIKNSKYSKEGLIGLLRNYNIVVV